MKKNRVYDILEFLLAFFMVLECRSVYMYSTSFAINLQYLFLAVLLLNIVVRHYKVKRIKKIDIGKFFAILSYFVIFGIINVKSANLLQYTMIAGAFIGLNIFNKTSEAKYSVLKKISQIMTGIAIISLFMYFCGYVLEFIKHTGTVNLSWGGQHQIKSYFNVFFLAQKGRLFGRATVERNTGVFVEAPMYSLLLTMALAIELFLKKEKINLKKVIILCITIVTTISSTGIVVMLVELVLRFLYNKRKGMTNNLKKIILLPVMIVVVASVASNLLETKSTTDSYTARTDDYVSTLKSFIAKPIMGHGFGNTQAIVQYMSSKRIENVGRSNSLQVVISEGGLYLFFIYLLGFGGSIKYSLKTKNFNIFAFSLIIFILFITTNFAYNYILLNFISMALNKNEEGLINEEKERSQKLYL